MDWLLLIYALGLATTPAHAVLGLPAGLTGFLLGSVPHGAFLVALVLILIRTLVPALRFEFGLSAGRWASLIALLLMEFLFLLGGLGGPPALFAQPAYQDTYYVVAGIGWESIPILIVQLATLFAFVMLFAGRPLGPKRRPTA